jgi:phosphonoacetaldehyde hydrolase
MSNYPIKAVIFDWAGTMIDFGCLAPVVAMRKTFSGAGIELEDAQIRAFMGKAKREHIKSILSLPEVSVKWANVHGHEFTEEDIDDLFDDVTPHMENAAAQYSKLIDGAKEIVEFLRNHDVKIGSCTGYSRQMMQPILINAANQGYEPDTLVCAGETSEGRPSPLMAWKILVELGVWPSRTCIKVDDAEVGIQEGREAGMWTIGVAASGNGIGLSEEEFHELSKEEQNQLVKKSAKNLADAGADYVINSIADLKAILPEIATRINNGEMPGRVFAS